MNHLKSKKMITFTCWNRTYRLETNDDDLYNLFESNRLYHLPITTITNTDHIDLKINMIFNSSKSNFVYSINKLEIYFSFRVACLSSFSFHRILFQGIAFHLSTVGEFALHASAISYKNNAHVLIGKTMAGKTLLSLSICKQLNADWIANDWLSVSKRDKLSVVNGYDYISIRETTFGYLNKMIDTSLLQTKSRNKESNWNKTKKLTSNQIGLSKAHLPIPIRAVYFINISHTSSNSVIELPIDKKANLLTNEILSILLGIGSSPLSHDGIIQSNPLCYDNKINYNLINAVINDSISSVPFFQLNSNIKFAISFFEEQFT